MGRRLSALEELQASLADPDADQRQGRTQFQQQLIGRIADTLGITTAELGGHPAPLKAIRPEIDMARQYEFVLTQQCTDLMEVFSRIQDPQDRLRCLQLVRDFAGEKSAGSTR